MIFRFESHLYFLILQMMEYGVCRTRITKKHFQSCQQAPSMENEICVNITGEIVVEDQLGFNMVSLFPMGKRFDLIQ